MYVTRKLRDDAERRGGAGNPNLISEDDPAQVDHFAITPPMLSGS